MGRWRLPFICKYLEAINSPDPAMYPPLLQDPVCAIQMANISSHPTETIEDSKPGYSLQPGPDFLLILQCYLVLWKVNSAPRRWL